MSEAGVPIVPGYHGEDQSDNVLKLEAEKIGYTKFILFDYVFVKIVRVSNSSTLPPSKESLGRVKN